MNHAESLLQAIHARPADLTPRLIYCDYLEEHGGPAERERAEYIRLALLLEELSPEDPYRRSAEERHRELELRWSERWLMDLANEGMLRPHFRRGFVEAVAINSHRLFALRDRLTRLAPLRELYLDMSTSAMGQTDQDAHIAALLELRVLEQIETLRLDCYGLAPETIQEFLRSPRLENLNRLMVRRSGSIFQALAGLDKISRVTQLILFSGDAWADRLLGSPALANLRQLELLPPVHEPEELLALVRNPAIRQLESLALRDLFAFEPLSNQLLEPFREASWPTLWELALTGFPLTAQVMLPVLSGPLLHSVESLDLRNTWLGREDSSHLRLFDAPRLRRLVLNNSLLDDQALHSLAAARNLESLRTLHLRTNRAPGLVSALKESPFWDQLEFLSAGYNGIGPAEAFALGTHWPAALRSLDLSWNPLGVEGAAGLSRGGPLTELNLGYCQLGDEGIFQLVQGSLCEGLQSLDLTQNRLTDRAIAALVDSGTLDQVNILRLGGNHLTEATVRTLLDANIPGRLRGLCLPGQHIEEGLRQQVRQACPGILMWV